MNKLEVELILKTIQSSIIGKTNVKIYSKDSTDVTIIYVFFILNLFWNLLSIRQLIEKNIYH